MQTFTWMLLFLHATSSWSHSNEPTHTPCNDRSVEKLARLALTYINADRTRGYKFALNRISNVHLHDQGPAGKVYYLDLDVLETKCHINSPKPWKRCDIRPFMETQISGNCNTTVLHTEDGFSYLYSYECTLVPDPPEKLLQKCPECPLLLPVDSPKARHAATLTLRRYNMQSTLPTSLALQNITRASAKSQSFPVLSTFVEYTVQECFEGNVVKGVCAPADVEKTPAGFCVGVVTGNVEVKPDIHVSCEIFQGIETPARVPDGPKAHDVSRTQHQTKVPNPIGHMEQAFPDDPRLTEPIRHTIDLADPDLAGPLVPSNSSDSSESESDSQSSEELGVLVARPPLDFRYQPGRQKRELVVGAKPVFRSVFPASPSPFRSCPGNSRYTTV